MITPKEREKKTVSRFAICILAAKWGISFKHLKTFFDINNIPYTFASIKVTYYRSRWGVIKEPVLKKEVKDQVYAILMDAVFVSIAKEIIKKPSKRFEIQGDYSSSINALFPRKFHDHSNAQGTYLKYNTSKRNLKHKVKKVGTK